MDGLAFFSPCVRAQSWFSFPRTGHPGWLNTGVYSAKTSDIGKGLNLEKTFFFNQYLHL